MSFRDEVGSTIAVGAAAVSLLVVGGGMVTKGQAQSVEWSQVPTCADSAGQHLNASNYTLSCGSSTPTGLANGGVVYPLGDNSTVISSGLYIAVGAFPWSSGNIISAGAGISATSMTFGLYSATSEGATLSAVPGCSAITVSAGGAATPTSCTSTPISRGGQIYISVSTVNSAGSNGWVQPIWNHTPT